MFTLAMSSRILRFLTVIRLLESKFCPGMSKSSTYLSPSSSSLLWSWKRWGRKCKWVSEMALWFEFYFIIHNVHKNHLNSPVLHHHHQDASLNSGYKKIFGWTKVVHKSLLKTYSSYKGNVEKHPEKKISFGILTAWSISLPEANSSWSFWALRVRLACYEKHK